jgi:heptosyltransferase-2
MPEKEKAPPQRKISRKQKKPKARKSLPNQKKATHQLLPTNNMKILVRVPNWIGDSILVLPAIECLHENYPEAEIWIIAKNWVKDLFTSSDFIKGVRLLPDQTNWKSFRNTAREIKQSGFDAGLLFTNSFTSAFLFYMAKIPQRWGYAKDGRQILLTKGVPHKNQTEPLHQADYYLNLLAGLGLKIRPLRLTLPVTPYEKRGAEDFLASLKVDLKKRLIILNPGAFYGSAKRWPAARYSELATLLQDKLQAEICIIGSPGETGLAESIAKPMSKQPFILAGKSTLRQLAGVMSLAALCVTNDSGPMHMANALKIPTVALFGPTDPSITAPFQEPSVYIKKEVPCWPCAYRECPFDHRCMVNITSEEVIEACQRLIS